MKNLIRNLLVKLIDDLDAGNTNITEEDGIKLVALVKDLTDKTKRISKYQACEILHMSRATFDNHVAVGNIPKGTHQQGFKELSWSLKDIEDFKNKLRKK